MCALRVRVPWAVWCHGSPSRVTPGSWRVRPGWPEGGYWAAGGRHNINDDDGTDPAFSPQLKKEQAETVSHGREGVGWPGGAVVWGREAAGGREAQGGSRGRERRKPGQDNLKAKSMLVVAQRLRSNGTRTGANMCSLPHPNH